MKLARFLVLLTGRDCYRQRLDIDILLIIIAVFVEHIAHHHSVAVIVDVVGDELAVVPKGVEKRFGDAAVFQVVLAAEGLVVDVKAHAEEIVVYLCDERLL